MESYYESTAQLLAKRIFNLIPNNMNILEFTNPFDLFKIKDFKCDDLSPSLFQASWALSEAKVLYKEKLNG